MNVMICRFGVLLLKIDDATYQNIYTQKRCCCYLMSVHKGMSHDALNEEGNMSNQLGITKLSELKYVVFDLETTGFSPVHDRIIQIGAIKMDGNTVLDKERFDMLVNSQQQIPGYITEFTHIDDARIKCEQAQTIDKVLPKFFEFAEDRILVAHNGIKFDVKFIQPIAEELKLPRNNFLCVDTLWLSRHLFPEKGLKHNLDALMERLHIEPDPELMRHDALGDVIYTAKSFVKMMHMLEADGKGTLMIEV